MNIPDKELKIFCPCCGKEIIIVIDDEVQNLSNDNELNKKSKKLDIEFGEQRGGEKENE